MNSTKISLAKVINIFENKKLQVENLNSVKYSENIFETINININKYDDDFFTTHLISEWGLYAYDCKIYGKVRRYQDEEVNYYETICPNFYIEIMNIYDDEGEEISFSVAEKTQIEFNLMNNIKLDFQEV